MSNKSKEKLAIFKLKVITLLCSALSVLQSVQLVVNCSFGGWVLLWLPVC